MYWVIDISSPDVCEVRVVAVMDRVFHLRQFTVKCRLAYFVEAPYLYFLRLRIAPANQTASDCTLQLLRKLSVSDGRTKLRQ